MNNNTENNDALADSLVAVAKIFSLTTDKRALLHGLPLKDGRLPLEHLEEAAIRAGLSIWPWTQPLSALGNSSCPALLIDDASGKVMIIEAISKSDGGAKIAHIKNPNGQRTEEKLDGLMQEDSVQCYILRPEKSVDERTNEIPVLKSPHWFWSALKINRGIYGHIIAGTLAVNLLALVVPLVTMNIYDRVVSNAAFTTLWSLAIGAGLAAIFDLILRTVRAIMIDRASARSDVMLSNRIFSKLLGARLKGRHSSVGVRANTLREFESLREFFNSATIAALGDLPFLVLFMFVIAMVAGPLVLVPLIAIPIVLMCGYLTQRQLDKIVSQGFLEAAQKSAVVVESLSGLETIKSLAAESWAAANWEKSVAAQLRYSLKARLLMSISSNMVGFATTLTTISLLVYGVYLVTAGTITPGAMFAATILNGRCMAPLSQLAGLLTRLHQARMAFFALRQIIDLPQERVEGASYLQKNKFDGRVTFDRVRFAYDEESADALRGISFDISPGEKVGIVGGVGSGKSTLMKLVLGLHQSRDGGILIDGLPIEQIDPASWRSAVGSHLQDTTLFHGDIRTNICLHAPEATDDQILRALNISGAIAWLRTLPHGIDTVIGERGEGLSGGQKQTLCLARSLLRRPDLLLLDEPTSHMDGVTEKNFITGISKYMGKRTLLLITHKPSLLVLVDRLIVLDRGKVLLDGEKEQVLQKLQEITSERIRKAS